jgi:hypothetical protein
VNRRTIVEDCYRRNDNKPEDWQDRVIGPGTIVGAITCSPPSLAAAPPGAAHSSTQPRAPPVESSAGGVSCGSWGAVAGPATEFLHLDRDDEDWLDSLQKTMPEAFELGILPDYWF